MDLLAILRQDYDRFPQDQTYDIYAEDVFFRDPLNQFRGIQRYQQMIGFMQRWFLETKLELHEIQQQDDRIRTDWTLRWVAPLPWRPHLAISGWSELTLNAEGKIVSHIDYWHSSPWQVLQQLWTSRSSGSGEE